MTLYIKSPKATQIKSVGTDFEAGVSKGDFLFELYDYEEQKILSQIDRAIKENSAKKLEAQGPFVQQKLASLLQISDHRGTSLQASQLAYEGVQQEYQAGQRTLLDVTKARQDMAFRSYTALQSGIEAEVYRRNADDSIRVFDHVDLILRAEREYVERSRSRLRILAPESGYFKRFVSADTPVRLGHLLGEIS